jgi:hypothetical protein
LPTKILYFDIDGTLLSPESEPKPALAGGAFEQAVREAGFARLVCVSNMGKIIQFLGEMGKVSDGLGLAFELCRGTFADETWFRQATTLAMDAEHRAQTVDYSADWWYLDDLAPYFMEKEGRSDLFKANEGKRIFAPDPNGSGKDILGWLRTCRFASGTR